ncbi:MAG: ABC transporter permease [Methanobacteriota archaeon]
MFSLTVRYLLTTRRGLATAALAATPILLLGSLALARVDGFDIVLFQLLMVPLFLQVVVVFASLVQATSLIREEIEDNTLPYLLTRPVSKPTILLSKYLGYLASVVLLLVPPLLAAYAITEAYAGDALSADRDVLAAFLVATVLAALAYGAFFTLLSVLVRRPLAAGLGFGFVWEFTVGSIPGDVPRLSIIHYLRSILKELAPFGPLRLYPSDVSAGVASIVLVAFAAAALVLAIVVFQQSEFKQKA